MPRARLWKAELTLPGASQRSQPLTAADGGSASGSAQTANGQNQRGCRESTHATGTPTSTAMAAAPAPMAPLRPSAANSTPLAADEAP
jgi:hypothetical protein